MDFHCTFSTDVAIGSVLRRTMAFGILHCVASVKSEKSTLTIDTITACAPNETTKQIECHIIHVIMCTNPITNGAHT